MHPILAVGFDPTAGRRDGQRQGRRSRQSTLVVPEPATYALLMGGSILAGLAVRRRFFKPETAKRAAA